MEALALKESARLVEYGVVGLFLLLALAVVVFLYRKLEASTTSRLTELQRVIETREDITKALAANTLALEANNRAMEARTRATEAVERAITELTRQSENNDDRIREKLDEVVQIARQCIGSQGGRP
ncbi:MAG TPA: hypothetical protein VGU45_05055 [Microvirga sp.]|jgi:F0F1-type ATP synthase membrane subunit b/b'|nr:hypothetical protein [Microvirga sp.]